MIEQRRGNDQNWICRGAYYASLGWDWIDKRQIFERFVSLAILFGTIKVIGWSMDFAETHTEKTGVDAGVIIAAVCAPYMALQAAAIAFMFRGHQ